MSGRDTKTTISNLLRMPRHKKESNNEKWLKNLLLRAKTVGQLTCGSEKHSLGFFFPFGYLGSEMKEHFI